MGDLIEKQTDSIGRSLLQKAIRRGDLEMTKKAFYHLMETGQFEWLRKRLAVFTFEECWPYALNVSYDKNESLILKHCINLAKARKNKNAAGLGELVYTYSESNHSIFKGYKNIQLIHDLSDKLKNPNLFWDEMKKQSMSQRQKAFFINSETSFRKASWEWDKAFVIAGAYLASKEGVPDVADSTVVPPKDFPLWVAIDKHTDKGKDIIKEAANQAGIDVYKAYQLSFYFEGATCNEISDSPWWDENVRLQMKRQGFSSLVDAVLAWNSIKPIIISNLQSEVDSLEKKIQKSLDKRAKRQAVEPSLFS